MTSKHTPGPWAVQNAEECTGRQLDDLVKWVVTGDQHSLWISSGPTWDPEHAEESEANARLIAAAPELLEALQGTRREIAALVAACGDGVCTAAALEAADTAIAKATGEA